MPTVRYTGSGHYRVPGEGFDPDDERDVDAETAEYLAGLGDFDVLEPESDDDVETCDTITSSDEICGRELPCRYHSDDEDEEAEG